MSNRLHLVLPVVAVLMTACGAQQPTASPTTAPAAVPSPSPATAAPAEAPTQARVVPTATSIQLQTQTPTAPPLAPSPTVVPIQTLPLFNGIPHGITPDGFHFLGMPDAPVTLTDYSDFL